MNGLFGIGPLELVVIAVLALIFIGPERLPGVIQQVFRIIGELRSYGEQVRTELTNEFAPMREELESFSRDISDASRDVTSGANEMIEQANSAMATSSQPEINAPPPPRESTDVLPAPATPHANGVAQQDDERPSFADYRPRD